MAKRTCGECRACCHTFAIYGLPLSVPRWCDCTHQGAGGCGIYPDRPDGCRNFRCAWLDGWGEPADRPDLLGVMLERREARPRIGVEESVRATEVRPEGAAGERALARLRALSEEVRVVLVDYGARGKATYGRELTS